MVTHLRSNLVAYLALFVALGGTSYAAINLPRNSVGTTQLKSNAVTSAKVRNGTLLAHDFKAGQLPAGAPGATGAIGAPGADGAPGTQGAPGAPGAPAPVVPLFAGTFTGGAVNPSATPDGSDESASYTFTMPVTGPAYMQYFDAAHSTTCSIAPGRAGLYLDGQPVPGTSAVVFTTANPILLIGTTTLTAGQHKLSVRADCPSGNLNSASNNSQVMYTVLALGS